METPAGMQTPPGNTPVQADIQTPAQPMQMPAMPVAARPNMQMPSGPPGYFPYGWRQPTPPPPPAWNYGQWQPSANSFPGPGQRAWFMKEHLDLVEKCKTRDLTDESKKSSHGESSAVASSRGDAKKGKGRDSVDDNNTRIKAWIANTFNGSLKKIVNKLDDVDRKTTVALDEKGEKNVKEEPATEGASGSNEKRKRDFGSPLIFRSRSKSRSKSAGGEVKMRPLRINILDDEDSHQDKIKENSHIDEKLEMAANTSDGKQLEETKGMLQALMTGLNSNAASKGCAASETTIEDINSGKGTNDLAANDEAKRDKGRSVEMQNEEEEEVQEDADGEEEEEEEKEEEKVQEDVDGEEEEEEEKEEEEVHEEDDEEEEEEEEEDDGEEGA
ncbi:hypothetical protein CBR_g2819 [Chara braunii]|uniref:Uncharacterized protein n=1 Tax=Chara braunii TaxID=69332 RepID=A0A388KDY5_CHABU|nr:hypothetical protein CBR_g2819 [Chara braunii]|eukprot:GBG68270.1 hypothetical protein CBR_g2819 [Chara braunii]